jgi:transposase
MSEQKEKVKKEPVKITVPMLQKLIDEGKSKEQIGKDFNLNASQTIKLFKAAKEKGLKIKITRVVKPAFILTDENEIVFEVDATENTIEAVISDEEKVKLTKVKKIKEENKVTTVDDSDLLQITHAVSEESDTNVEKEESNENDW